jgi:hypothetical protein
MERPPKKAEKPEQPSMTERMRESLVALFDRAMTALRKPEPIIDERPDIFTAEEREFLGLGEVNERLDRMPRAPTNMLLAGIVLMNATCAAEAGSRHATPDEKPASVDFTMDGSSVDIEVIDSTAPDPYEIHIVDYNNTDAWDVELESDYIPDAKSDVQRNAMYQYHVSLFKDAYMRSFVGRASPDAESVLATTKSEDEFKVNKYDNEASLMPIGLYPTVGEMYSGAGKVFWPILGADPVVQTTPANFEMGDQTKVESYFFTFAQQYAEQNGWTEEPQNFSAQQWILILDASVNAYPYDTHLASGSEDYDPALAARVNAMPISELIERTQDGVVCRDLERMKISFYQVANERYDLSARGLQILPLVNFSDAKHARDAYMIATNDHEVTVVVTDSTNTAYNKSEQQLDSGMPSASIWYGAQYGREFLPPALMSDFFDTMLYSDQSGMFPTTEAIAYRERLVAKIQLAIDAEARGQEEEAIRIYSEAYNDLSLQLAREYMYEQTIEGSTLRRPDRTVPLLDLLLQLGKKSDDGDRQTNYWLALQQLEQYKNDRGMSITDLNEARTMVQELDAKGTADHSKGDTFVATEVSRLEKALGIH